MANLCTETFRLAGPATRSGRLGTALASLHVTRQINAGTDNLTAEVDDDGVLRIVLDNPERFNSLTAAMLAGLRGLLAEASQSEDVRVVLIEGRGEKAFASGADIEEQADRAAAEKRNPDRGDFVSGLLGCTKPVVAKIRGYCLGGGLLVALAADIRIASDDAQFSIPAARLGVAYPLAATTLLAEIVGRGAASHMLLTGDRFGAAHALRIGLVTTVVPGPELEARTGSLLTTLCNNAPLSMSAAKASISHALAPQPSGRDEVIGQIDGVWASADAREGMEAFFEKRPPKFEGR